MDDRSILIVDDEESILNAIERELYFWRAEKGVNIYKATSAAGAMEILEERHESINVLISDLKMSKMSGDQLIREAKKRYPRIRSILMTGYSELGGVSKAVSSGITAFIPKPWETNVFIAEIEKAMTQFRDEAADREHQKKLLSQLERTGRIQRKLFTPKDYPSTRYTLDIVYQPLDEFQCGGDFYHIAPFSEERCFMIVGDVSGHGVEAAFLTGIVRTLISREEDALRASGDFSPAGFLKRLNGLILKELEKAPEFIVAVTAVYLDCAKRKLVLSNAGNMPIYVINSVQCSSYSVPGQPCGFPGEAAHTDLEIPIQTGDRIALMTDGLLERGREAGYINMNAMKAVFSHFVENPDFNKRIVNFIVELFPEGKFTDDITLITAKIR